MMHVVADTTKVRIFKQITTASGYCKKRFLLLLIPQRYEFSSKSQRILLRMIFFLRCCWYHKGTNFQANHNWYVYITNLLAVVADTTKVRIFKQITTELPTVTKWCSCCWYHKGTNFQANHNRYSYLYNYSLLLLIPQRYEFSSKSQQRRVYFY